MITVDGRKMQWRQGLTVDRLLEILEDVEHVAVLRLNGKLISLPNFSVTPVPDGAIIELIPLIAGG